MSVPISWGGLIKYNDETFNFYDESDSEVPLHNINCINTDEFDNKWIGTFMG
ncbi:MAG: hypothetical protein H6613_09615 [Ignavibacteriales bacterium]|nr:hypothetical protein [Ignavibacteriales bacterium]